MPAQRMNILSIHAHFDDYEFTAAGTFEMWKRKLGRRLRAKVIVCTDGKAGHHFQTREETGRIRLQEQLASAKIGGYEFEPLRYPNGEVPREACLQVTTDRSEEHTSELQSHSDLVCRLLLEKKKTNR